MARLRFYLGRILRQLIPRRSLPFFASHHLWILCAVVGMILLSVLLAGCTSSSMANLYLTSTSYKSVSSTYNPEQVNPNLTQTFATIVDGAVLEVRVGYFGLCVSHAGGIWLCSNNPAGMASQFRPAQDPLNLIWAAAKFKDDIVFSGLFIVAIVLSSVTFLLFATFPPGWHSEFDDDDSVQDFYPFPSRPVLQVALASAVLATLFTMISILWQHTASIASATTVQDMAYGSVESRVGSVAIVLGWLGLIFLSLSWIGLFIFIRFVRSIDELVDPDL